MKRNVGTILSLSALFGIALGLYEYAFPWFLREEGISARHMGLIFSASFVAMYALRIYVGNHSEALGRKRFMTWSLGACGIATAAGGLVAGMGGLATRIATQLSLKSVREGAVAVREAMHPVLIYENLKARFTDLVAKSRSVDFLGQSAGKLAGGALVGLVLIAGAPAGRFTLVVAGSLVLAGAAVFHVGFRETGFRPGERQRLTVGKLLPWGLPRELALIAAAGFVLSFGLFMSHTFVISTWFVDKFGASQRENGVILSLHRLSLALPLFFSGQVILARPKWRLKPIYIASIAVEGLLIAASAVVPKSFFLAAVVVWLLHDLVGAGIYLPIQEYYIQRFAREGSRALDVSRLQAFASMGGVFAPLATSWLIEVFPKRSAAGELYSDAPWLLSGVIVALSVVPLLFLPAVRMKDEEGEAERG